MENVYVKILLRRIIKLNNLPVTTKNVLITTSVLFYEQFLILCRCERKKGMRNIKTIKYIILALMLSIGFVFNGELFILYADDFQDSFYQASFAFDGMDNIKSMEESVIIEDFINAGRKYNVDFFMVKSSIKSAYEKEIIVFGNENVFATLMKKGIEQGNFESLFTGKTIIKYMPFNEIENIKQYGSCYILGNESNMDEMRKFKTDLIDDYGGGFPRLYGSDRSLYASLFSVWLIIIGIMIMISLYEIMVTKRERAIRYILGENLTYIAIKNIVVDTLIYILLIISVPYLLESISNIRFKYFEIIIVLAGFILVNVLIQLMNVYVNTKKYLNIKYEGSRLLQFAYLVKGITTVLTIIVLSANLICIVDDINLYEQREFFKENSNFNYYKLSYRPGTEYSHPGVNNEDIQREFYSRFYENSMQFADLKNQFGYEDDVVLVNRKAFDWIQNRYATTDYKNIDYAKCTYYILYPSNMHEKSTGVKNATNIIKSGLGKVDENGDFISYISTSDIRYIQYIDQINIVAINNLTSYKSTLRKQPIIIFDASIPFDEKYNRSSYWNYGTIYDIPEEEINFMHEYNLQNQIYYNTGIFEVYNYNWLAAWRNLRLMMVLSVILLLLELGIITFIVSMQFRINSIKIALMKIHGYTLYSRNKIMFFITLLSSMLGLLCELVVAQTFEEINTLYVIAVAIMIFLLEIIIIALKIIKVENKKLYYILKGEYV